MTTPSTATERVGFSTIKHHVRRRFDEMLKSGKKLFVVDYDHDAIWEAYLQGFPEAERQEFNCSSCRSFIRQAGPVVVIGDDLSLQSIWEHNSPSPGVRALAAYVEGRPIARPWYHDLLHVGTDKSPDPEKGIVWEHFYVEVPKSLRKTKRNELGRAAAHLRESRIVMVCGFETIEDDAIETVLDLIGQNSLYRGNEYQHIVDKFAAAQKQYRETPLEQRENISWLLACELPENVARCRNTAIGTLLVDLSEGTDVESAVRAFERMVAPANYKRPTAIVTPKMVKAAKEKLEELGLISALKRRRLDDRDLTAADALYVFRPTTVEKDVFEELTEERPVTRKELDKVETITIERFLADVLPRATDVKAYVERNHLGNFVTLTGPQDPDAKNLMKWDNSFGWSYSGGVADSIKERVKAAGGNVDGWLRASLAWYNHDDLDLHLFDNPNREEIYYGHKKGRQAWLDVDMNAGGRMSREPVENITCDGELKPGKYVLKVHQFRDREKDNKGYELEIEVNGEVHTFGSSQSPRQSQADAIQFKVMDNGEVVLEADPKMTKAGAGVTKWGVRIGIFTRIRAITLSPNHWTKPVGNKHYMFLLEGCVSDEATRGFYNEFLTESLAKERKTTEALASKVEVAPAAGAELSGVGFSDTQRNHLYVDVLSQSGLRRMLKITF